MYSELFIKTCLLRRGYSDLCIRLIITKRHKPQLIQVSRVSASDKFWLEGSDSNVCKRYSRINEKGLIYKKSINEKCLEEKHYIEILEENYLNIKLVAGAGFEPTTFGL